MVLPKPLQYEPEHFAMFTARAPVQISDSAIFIATNNEFRRRVHRVAAVSSRTVQYFTNYDAITVRRRRRRGRSCSSSSSIKDSDRHVYHRWSLQDAASKAGRRGEASRRVMGECGDWNRIVIRAGFKVGQTGQLPRASTSRGAPQKQ